MKRITKIFILTLLLFITSKVSVNTLPGIETSYILPIDNDCEDIHVATWYSLPGNKTASGEMYHNNTLTAAYNFAKIGTLLSVTNISNNKSIIVRVNDRMGIKSRNRIDLTTSAFDSIGNRSSGRIKVAIKVISTFPI